MLNLKNIFFYQSGVEDGGWKGRPSGFGGEGGWQGRPGIHFYFYFKNKTFYLFSFVNDLLGHSDVKQ